MSLTIAERNTLELDDPSTYICQLYRYRLVHQLMTIKVFSKTDTRYVTLSPMLYFDGPFMWHGADFCLASVQDCQSLLHYVMELDPIDDPAAMAKFYSIDTKDQLMRLYIIPGIVPGGDISIRILTSRHVMITSDDPWNHETA
jgi:hypothetical protein